MPKHDASSPVTLTFTDYHALLALHRALMEAKFCEVANDPAVAGSPFVATIANDVVDALTHWRHAHGDPDWVEWRRISPDRREWPIAVARAARADSWERLDTSVKHELVRCLLSPFTFDGTLRAEFVKQVDAARSRDDLR